MFISSSNLLYPMKGNESMRKMLHLSAVLVTNSLLQIEIKDKFNTHRRDVQQRSRNTTLICKIQT